MDLVKEVQKEFSGSASVVFLGFSGLTVPTVTELRSRFRNAGVKYKVLKNTLIEHAVKGTQYGEANITSKLKGETGVAFSYEDPSVAAKVIKAFRGEGEDRAKLLIKGAMLESTVMDAKQVENDLATIPTKDELRSQLLAVFEAPASQLLAVLEAPLRDIQLVLQAKADK